MPVIIPKTELEKTKKYGLLDTILRAVGTDKEEVKDFLKELNFAMEAYPPAAELYAVPKATVKLAPKILENLSEIKEATPALGMVINPKNIEKFKKVVQETYNKLHDIDFKFPVVPTNFPFEGGLGNPIDLLSYKKLGEPFKKAFAHIKTRYPKQTEKTTFALSDIGEEFSAYYSPRFDAVVMQLLEAKAPYSDKLRLLRLLKHELSHASDRRIFQDFLDNFTREPYYIQPNELRARKNELEEVLRYWLLKEEIPPEIFEESRKKLTKLDNLSRSRLLFEKIKTGLPSEEYSKLVQNRLGGKFRKADMDVLGLIDRYNRLIDLYPPAYFLNSPIFLSPGSEYKNLRTLYNKLKKVQMLPTTAEELHRLTK